MKAFIALKDYIHRHKSENAKFHYLRFCKTTKLIYLIYASLTLFFIFFAMSKSSASDSVLSQNKEALSTAIDARKTNTAKVQTSIPSDWIFFSMSTDQDAALFYSPGSARISGNQIELMVKWIYYQKQGPAYANSQKILKLALGDYNYTLSYGIGLFIFDCASRMGAETKEIYFDAKGNVIFSFVPEPLVARYFASDTVYGYLLSIVCPK